MAPNIVRFPGQLSSFPLISLGAVGYVFKINDRIALKYSKTTQSDSFARENAMFDLFATHPPCPHIIQSFLRLPDINFLALMSGGSLEDRLSAHKVRDAHKKVLQVTYTEPPELVWGWLVALCSAVVWLESIGYVHGDLRPNNMLLDEYDRLRLADFDCAEKFGYPSSGNGAPWARVLGDDARNKGERGSFGTNGARTEQFAVGSNLYYMVYGFEPYEDREDQGPIIVELLQAMEFPQLQSGNFDLIIDKCWKGGYQQLQDMLSDARELGSKYLPATTALSVNADACRAECEGLVKSGLLGTIKAEA